MPWHGVRNKVPHSLHPRRVLTTRRRAFSENNQRKTVDFPSMRSERVKREKNSSSHSTFHWEEDFQSFPLKFRTNKIVSFFNILLFFSHRFLLHHNPLFEKSLKFLPSPFFPPALRRFTCARSSVALSRCHLFHSSVEIPLRRSDTSTLMMDMAPRDDGSAPPFPPRQASLVVPLLRY
jgi:hypothetical protein